MLSRALLIRLCSIVSMLAVAAGVMVSAPPASAALQKFVYQIRHSTTAASAHTQTPLRRR